MLLLQNKTPCSIRSAGVITTVVIQSTILARDLVQPSCRLHLRRLVRLVRLPVSGSVPRDREKPVHTMLPGPRIRHRRITASSLDKPVVRTGDGSHCPPRRFLVFSRQKYLPDTIEIRLRDCRTPSRDWGWTPSTNHHDVNFAQWRREVCVWQDRAVECILHFAWPSGLDVND